MNLNKAAWRNFLLDFKLASLSLYKWKIYELILTAKQADAYQLLNLWQSVLDFSIAFLTHEIYGLSVST